MTYNWGYPGETALCLGLMEPRSDEPRVFPMELDSVGPWLVTIDALHHEVHEGESFYYQDVVTMGNNATQDYVLNVSASNTPHFGYSVDGLYGVTVEMFEHSNKDGTTPQTTVFNRNRMSAHEPTFKVAKGTTGGSADGTRMLWKKSGSGVSGGRVSGSSSDGHERILKLSATYIFRVTSAAASNDVNVEFNWYEEGLDTD